MARGVFFFFFLLDLGLCGFGARPCGVLLRDPGQGGGEAAGPLDGEGWRGSPPLGSFFYCYFFSLFFFLILFYRARSPCPCHGPVWGGFGRVSPKGTDDRVCGYPGVRVSREVRVSRDEDIPG